MKNTSLESVLLQEAPRGFERHLGVLCLLIGVAFTVFTFVLVLGPLLRRHTVGLYVLVTVSASLACLLLVAGIRLLVGQRSGRRSLFAPWVWFTISGTMLLAAVAFSVVAAAAPTFSAGQGIASALLLALLAFGAGCHFRSKPRPKRSAA